MSSSELYPELLVLYNANVPAPLLTVSNLNIQFRTASGFAAAVRDVCFTIEPGEVLGLVGESGSGKSVTSLAVMRLLVPQARVSGSIQFEGRELLAIPETEMRSVRGAKISMIFQEPMTALNPLMRVGDQVAEAILAHATTSAREQPSSAVTALPSRAQESQAENFWHKGRPSLNFMERLLGTQGLEGLLRKGAAQNAGRLAIQALRDVGIPDPEQRARDYPHQLSGGQRQRVMIAMAIVNRPHLLIADEPTTALDVTVQAQILELLADLREKFKLAMLFISHDLGVVSQISDRVAVMYAGQIVELGSARQVFTNPLHEYTQGLLHAIPTLHTERGRLLATVESRKYPDIELREVEKGHWARV